MLKAQPSFVAALGQRGYGAGSDAERPKREAEQKLTAFSLLVSPPLCASPPKVYDGLYSLKEFLTVCKINKFLSLL